MINFSPLTVADRQFVQQYIMFGERQGCDLSFANLICWQPFFDAHFAVVNNSLALRFTVNGRHAYAAPIANSYDDHYADTINALRLHAAENNEPFLMLGVCPVMRSVLERLFPDEFTYTADRNRSDYIYLRQSLATLAGKKLQAKRNHTNKFRSLYPNYSYRPLTPDMLPQCLALVEQWYKAKQSTAEATSENDTDLPAIRRAFAHWEALALIGGALFVDSTLVAFSYGCPINHNTFDVCVEKANTAYEGAYSVINQEFVNHLPQKYTFINREEDMGQEGLRRAKLSYRPHLLLEKYRVEEATTVKAQTIRLWRKVFGDEEQFIRIYFSRLYSDNNNVCVTVQDNAQTKVVAALQAIPFTVRYEGKEITAAYISGVCVDYDYRRKGFGQQLMTAAHQHMQRQGVAVACLIPAEAWLYDWYGAMGYIATDSPVSVPLFPQEPHTKGMWQTLAAEPIELPHPEALLAAAEQALNQMYRA